MKDRTYLGQLHADTVSRFQIEFKDVLAMPLTFARIPSEHSRLHHKCH